MKQSSRGTVVSPSRGKGLNEDLVDSKSLGYGRHGQREDEVAMTVYGVKHFGHHMYKCNVNDPQQKIENVPSIKGMDSLLLYNRFSSDPRLSRNRIRHGCNIWYGGQWNIVKGKKTAPTINWIHWRRTLKPSFGSMKSCPSVVHTMITSLIAVLRE